MEVTGGSNFVNKIPAMGTYNARIARIIDFGTQEKTYNGQVTGTRHSGEWVLELVDTNEDFGKGVPEPFFVHTKELTFSLGGTSNTLRDYIGSLLGRPIVKAENIKLNQFMNMPCMIQVVHAKSKDGSKTYANIAGLMAHPTPAMVAPLRTQPIFFEISATDPNIFNNFLAIQNKWTQGIIVKSPEFQQIATNAGFPWQQHIFTKGAPQTAAPQTPMPTAQFAAPQQQFQPPVQQPAQGAWQPPQPQWAANANQFQQQQPAPQAPPQPQWQQPAATVPPPAQPQWAAPQPSSQPAVQQQWTPQPPAQAAAPQPSNPFDQPVMVANPNYNPNVVGSQQFVPATTEPF